MTLKLTVVMNDPNGWAKTYSLADYTTGYSNITDMRIKRCTCGCWLHQLCLCYIFF